MRIAHRLLRALDHIRGVVAMVAVTLDPFARARRRSCDRKPNTASEFLRPHAIDALAYALRECFERDPLHANCRCNIEKTLALRERCGFARDLAPRSRLIENSERRRRGHARALRHFRKRGGFEFEALLARKDARDAATRVLQRLQLPTVCGFERFVRTREPPEVRV